MKKLILFVLLSVTTFYYGYSQSLSLADSTGPIANNGNVTSSGPDNAEITSYCFVHNNSANALTLLVKKVEISLVSGTENTFCWGLCYPPGTYISPNPEVIGGLRTDSVDFSGHYTPHNLDGVSVIRYVFFDQSNPNDSVCFNVHYDSHPLGISNLISRNMLSSAYPNPANNTVTFNYSVNSLNSGSVIIRNLLGSEVKQSALPNAAGKLSIFIGDLPEGVYFYSLNVDGANLSTHKLIVKH